KVSSSPGIDTRPPPCRLTTMTQTEPSPQVHAADSAIPPGASLSAALSPSGDVPWWKLLDRYHWFVFFVAALGWLFDCLDQQLFILARKPAMVALLHTSPDDTRVEEFGGYTTAIFIMGWAAGGLLFGVLGDRLGRVRTLVLTILLYSLFTGLSAFSVGVWDFAFYRFLT